MNNFQIQIQRLFQHFKNQIDSIKKEQTQVISDLDKELSEKHIERIKKKFL